MWVVSRQKAELQEVVAFEVVPKFEQLTKDISSLERRFWFVPGHISTCRMPGETAAQLFEVSCLNK